MLSKEELCMIASYCLFSEPTDMRKRFHTLSGLVCNSIKDGQYC